MFQIPGEKILVVLAFITALLLLLIAVRVFWADHRQVTSRGRRIRVLESTQISATEKALIIGVDEREFVLLRLKGTAPVFCPIEPRNPSFMVEPK